MTSEQKTPGAMANPYVMSDNELRKFVRLVYDECGIALTDAKKSMLSARLAKRLRALGLNSFKEYYELLTDTPGQTAELIQMVDVVTTNTTYFFRERNHFDYLTQHVLPKITTRGETLRVWSAGCSSGEEPYTLAMVLSDYFQQHPGDFHITATDISTRVLAKAAGAIYDDEAVEGIPSMTRRKYMMRGKGAQTGRWRVVPELRNKVQFYKLNFMDDDYGITEPFDIIFCRNVIIYFDWETKSRLINRFEDHLVPGGYLFIGHSETLNGMSDTLKAVAPTVYRKPDSHSASSRRVAA